MTPDASRCRLAERPHGLARPGHRDDDVVAAASRPRCRILLDSAEQHELFASEIRRHHHPMIGKGSDQPLAGGRRNRHDERAERSKKGKWGGALHDPTSYIRWE